MNEVNSPQEDRFRVRTYENGKITEEYSTLDEVLRLKPTDVDFHWDKAFGKIRIRKRNGKIIKYFGRLPGVGQVTKSLLAAMMKRPGQLLTSVHLSAITKSVTFDEHYRLSQRMTRLREAFGEQNKKRKKNSGKNRRRNTNKNELSWYFIGTKDPFAVGWNPKRTWRIIQMVVPGSKTGQK